ncbi:MAG: penicillin-binding protein 1C [Candidatus Sungbacteria bacterium]|nr:penicillin-binding protein 1C [Candidatus Sungbacteria bacterium]
MIVRIIISISIGIVISFAIVIPFSAHRQFAKTLANPAYIVNRKDTGIILLDRHGRSFFHLYSAKSKRVIPLSQVPLTTQQAVIAIEDQTFYKHKGISLRGITRAAAANAKAGKIMYGGSTITQQIVKNTLLTSQKSWLRKYQEAFLALELEIRYTKPEILAMYFNTAYFGEGAFGIEEAAHTYFNKPSQELSLSESALLAGLLTEPSRLSPLSHDPAAARIRQRLVLENMVELGLITQPAKQAAINEKLAFNPEPIMRSQAAPHFALYVKDQLVSQFGEQYVASSGLKVTTTIDLDIQAAAEAAVNAQLTKLARQGATNGSAVVIDPATHEILAMVGSRNWFADTFGKVNMAISPRQTGSAFKPIVYAAGFEKRAISPATILQDSPTTFGTDYKPADYDGKYRGPVSVRRALANSLNIPAVSVMQKVGVKTVAHIAQAFGITSLPPAEDYNLALALGAGGISPLELTNAYATLASDGQYKNPQSILNISDKRNQAIHLPSPKATQAISPETAFLVSSILSDNQARAEIFGRSLTISRPAAVKTGTSQDYRDAWTVGYTPQFTVGIWVGNNDNTPMRSLAGSLGAAPIWKQIMETLHANKPAVAFIAPSTIQQVTLCRKLAATQEADAPKYISYQEYFLAGDEPKNSCYKTTFPKDKVSPKIVERIVPPAQALEPSF